MNTPAAQRPEGYARTVYEGLERELITPEGVDLKVKLADVGARFGAFIIDLMIIVISLIVFTIGLIYAVFGGDTNMGGEMGAVIWFLVFFFLRNFYFTFFEIGPKAATPGKRLMKIRVASRKGDRLTAPAVFARNAIRELELFLPLSFMAANTESVDGVISLLGLIWSAIFLLFPFFNKDNLRAGDLIAGTWVIMAPRPVLDIDLSSARKDKGGLYDFTSLHVKAYGVHELHVLERVIRKNDKETVKAVAERIRGKIGWEQERGEYDKDFISAYYAALREHLEMQMLLGKRRRDKFDI